MKKTFLVLVAIMLGSVINAFPQGNNWKLDGNSNVNYNSFIGTTNAVALIFKTNNTEYFEIDANGNLIVNSFKGNYSGVVCSNTSGVLNKLDFSGNAAQYLAGDGNFKDISAFAGWQVDHNNILSALPGNVGIGINAPTEKLDVNGNIRTSGIVYANGGLVVGTFKQGIAIVTTSLGVGTNNPTQQIDVVGNIKASGTVYADLVRTDSLQLSKPLDIVSLHVVNKIKVGNSMYLEGYDPGGPLNAIYTDGIGDPKLYIQNQVNPIFFNNTIINPYAGNVGIGTTNPSAIFEIASLGSEFGNTLPIIRNNGTTGAGFQFIAGGGIGSGAKNWVIHSSGPNNSQGAGKFIFHNETDSIDALVILPDGKIGIGTTTPIANIHINSIVGSIDYLTFSNYDYSQGRGGVLYRVDATGDVHSHIYRGSLFQGTELRTGNYAFGDDPLYATYLETVNFKVGADGMIYARGITLQAGTFPDFVFDKDYNLMSLSELENYIRIHKHLPKVPSAAEVKEKGVNLGELNTTLLQKIEELTLYTISLQKQVDELKKQIENK